MTSPHTNTAFEDDGESTAVFRHLFESAPDAMIVVDDEGRIVLMNGQAELMFGYTISEILGESIERLVPQRSRDEHRAHRDQFIRSPRLRRMGRGMALSGARKDGSEFPAEISLSPIVTPQGRFVSSVIRDITERREMERKIRSSQREAELANKANSAFLAAASHDLRQPVQALSLLNGALRRTVSDERALSIIESQEVSLTAMTNLLNSLLDISRLDAGAIQPEWEEFPMQRLVDRLSAEFGRQAQQKGLTFTSGACSALVRSDANLLAEVITNLVSNAIRYTDKGTVSLTCEEIDGVCQLHVRDTGIGIEPAQQQEIFKEFHQCKTVGASKEGFGLGLAIVRRLTDLLGHRIEVESEPGRGSRFSVGVPIIASTGASASIDEQMIPAPMPAATGLIVLIEDDASVADAWTMLLEAEGYRTATASSAREAASLVRHLDETPVLLISDFHLLENSTGVEAVRRIREHFDRNIPAFIVSGDTSKVVKEARLIENCALMSKPIDTRRLLLSTVTAINTGRVPAD